MKRKAPTPARKAATAAHKRARTGATSAAIDASRLDDGVLVLVVNDVLTKNDRYKLVRIGKRAAQAETDLAAKFKQGVRAAAEAAGFILGAGEIREGLWRLDVLSVWPKQRHHADGTTTAFGDADAPVPMIKDALQRAGVIDDDMRIVDGSEKTCHIKGERRVVAVLTRIDPAQHARDVADMLTKGIHLLTC